MACANRRRVFRLPRRADQSRGDCCIPLPRRQPLAPATMSAQPESEAGLDADGETRRRVPPKAAGPPPLAEHALCRQTPKVGAECPNWARSDLCGGLSAMGVPTANILVSGRARGLAQMSGRVMERKLSPISARTPAGLPLRLRQ